jgi:hypothetical protein
VDVSDLPYYPWAGLWTLLGLGFADAKQSNRGRKRKTGGRGRQKVEEAEAVPFQADVLVALPIVLDGPARFAAPSCTSFRHNVALHVFSTKQTKYKNK